MEWTKVFREAQEAMWHQCEKLPDVTPPTHTHTHTHTHTQTCISPEQGANAKRLWGRVGWMLADHRDGLSSSSFWVAWSSIAQTVCQWLFSLLGIWVARPWWVRILHSAEEDNLSPFDSNIACLCQSIEINNNKHVYRKHRECCLPSPQHHHHHHHPPPHTHTRTGQNGGTISQTTLKCILENKKLYIMIRISLKCVFLRFKLTINIVSGNDLAPHRRQAITWTNADPVRRRIYVATWDGRNGPGVILRHKYHSNIFLGNGVLPDDVISRTNVELPWCNAALT